MPRLICLTLLVLALAVPAYARDERPEVAGQFDYYVLSLSWSPQYCADAPGDRDRRQCASGRRYAFVLHGLWPQNERGFPQSCAEGDTLPRALVDDMLDVMPSPSISPPSGRATARLQRPDRRAYFAAALPCLPIRCDPRSFQARVREIYVDPRTISATSSATIPPCPAGSRSSAAAATSRRCASASTARSIRTGREIRSLPRRRVIGRPVR
jgi:ribonuclease T2